jgi:hypothetical protein
LCILGTTIVKFRNLKQGTKMTKMIKMSLIAAVAVTSMTSVASAQNLEDAIKGVDFSGNLRYRYTNGEATTTDVNEYRLEMTVKSKVNDMVTATVSTEAKSSTGDTTVATSPSFAAANAGDADPVAATIAEANFAFALPGATVIAGKQALATPFASGLLEDQQGTGVVALVPVAGVTVAAGLYLNSDAQSKNNGVATLDLGAHNIAALAAIGSAANVKYAAWYAKVSETDLLLNNALNATTQNISAGASALNLNVSMPVGPVNVEVNYAKVDYTSSANNTNAASIALAKAVSDYSPTQSRIVLSGKVDTVTLVAGMVMAGKDGADVTLGDDDSSANFGAMEKFTAVILKDTTAYYLAAKAPVGPVTVGLEHGMASEATGKGTKDASETKLSVAYAMSKNFTVSGWVTSCSDALDNQGQNRIEVLYKF